MHAQAIFCKYESPMGVDVVVETKAISRLLFWL